MLSIRLNEKIYADLFQEFIFTRSRLIDAPTSFTDCKFLLYRSYIIEEIVVNRREVSLRSSYYDFHHHHHLQPGFVLVRLASLLDISANGFDLDNYFTRVWRMIPNFTIIYTSRPIIFQITARLA